jgi:hypothetical protein
LLGSITTALQAATSASVDKVFGVQFDVANTGLKDIVITKFQVPLDTGTHPVEVWLRNGSHKGSVAGCSKWHNTCGQWMKIVSASVVSVVNPLFKMTSLLLKMNIFSLKIYCGVTMHFTTGLIWPHQHPNVSGHSKNINHRCLCYSFSLCCFA